MLITNMLSVTVQSIIMLSAVILIAIMECVSMLIGIMLSAAMQSVIILSVVAPSKTLPQTISKILARIPFFRNKN